jgi:hypothetical protein
MVNRYVLAFTVLAAFANPVPSRAEFHPIKWRSDPIADDMMGSGLEAPECRNLIRSAGCDEPMERKVARQWRDLAGRVRRLAALSSAQEQERLLALAAAYEARAKRWEEQHNPPAAG